jgi:hypothetical protein
MLAVGDNVTVLFSECKGFGAEKVGHCGTVTRVEPLTELVGMYRVEFPDGVWHYLDREVEKTESMPLGAAPQPSGAKIDRPHRHGWRAIDRLLAGAARRP